MKKEEQDKRDEDFDLKIQENNKKDEEQDLSIKQAIDQSSVSLEMPSTPSEGSYRTYIVKQGGNDIGKIEIPFSSLVKSATYDPENNLLIFTVDNDKEIKVDLTKLIEDSDLVQRKIFDDFKNEISSFSSDTVDSISELSAATSNANADIKELEQKTRPCEIEKLGKYTMKIVLTQGLNRQIRRMCETRNYKVLQLKRVRIMNVFLASLKPGEYRELDDEECKMLYNQCRLNYPS